MMRCSRYEDLDPVISKDGSIVRELMHPKVHGNVRLSVAEAIVPPHSATRRHQHHQSEEIYHFLSGHAVMVLGDARLPVAARDTVCILPGIPHQLLNTSDDPVRLICCCSPPYSHDDTEVMP